MPHRAVWYRKHGEDPDDVAETLKRGVEFKYKDFIKKRLIHSFFSKNLISKIPLKYYFVYFEVFSCALIIYNNLGLQMV